MTHLGTVTLESERLTLRRFTMDDAKTVYRNWASDDEVTKYLTWPTHKSVDDSRAFMDFCVKSYESPETYQWGIELKATGELIGNISVVKLIEKIDSMELGWVLSRKYWSQGYMTEAAQKVIDFLFTEVGAGRVCAAHDTNNPASGRVMQKAGMKFEGVLRQSARNNRGIVDLAVYSILSAER